MTHDPMLDGRFWSNVVKGDGCWEWTGYVSGRYGRIRVGDGRRIQAHRFSYELHYGATDSPVICHRCDNPLCVRPDHLFAGDQAANLADMTAKGRHGQQRKTHCKHGHEFTPDNTFIDSEGSRRCRICRNRIEANRRRAS